MTGKKKRNGKVKMTALYFIIPGVLAALLGYLIPSNTDALNSVPLDNAVKRDVANTQSENIRVKEKMGVKTRSIKSNTENYDNIEINEAAAPPNFYPRDADEWQGMLVDQNMAALCDETENCGLGMACIGGKCLPCSDDSQCAAGESCVLDHCVLNELVECYSRSDCGVDMLCILTGYSNDPRGNSEMQSICLADTGGTPQEEPPEEQVDDSVYYPSPIETADLVFDLKAQFEMEHPEINSKERESREEESER